MQMPCEKEANTYGYFTEKASYAQRVQVFVCGVFLMVDLELIQFAFGDKR